MKLKVTGLALCVCWYSIACDTTNQSDSSARGSSSARVLDYIAAHKEECSSDVVAYANASIAEMVYASGKSATVRPIMIDCRIHSVRGKKLLRLQELNPHRDTDSYSIFFFDTRGRLREIVEDLEFDPDIRFEVNELNAIVEEVPLSDFETSDDLRIRTVRPKFKIPRGTPMAVATHTRSGVMSNAVAVRVVGEVATTEPASP